MGLGQRLMAHGFAGCVCSTIGAVSGGWLGWILSQTAATSASRSFDPQFDSYFLHLPGFASWLLVVAIAVLVGALCGSILGFLLGAGANIVLTQRNQAGRLETQEPPPGNPRS